MSSYKQLAAPKGFVRRSITVKPSQHLRQRHRAPLQVQNATSDYSINVNGDIRKVFRYISDLENRPTWDPATLEVSRVASGDASGVGVKYEFVQSPLPTMRIPIRYTVAECEYPKKLVLYGKAEDFVVSKSFIFMEHPARPNLTIVRQVYDIKMKDWKSMIPMLESQLAKKESTAFQNLEKLLNGSNTPLVNVMLSADDMKYRAKHPKEEKQNKGWDMASNLGSVFSGMFKQAASDGQATSGTTSGTTSSRSYTQAESKPAVVSDALGYYRVLGLEASATTTTDDIKSAFRKAAMQVHPDKLAGADDRAKQTAQLQFQILQAAYETLKDPMKRQMYDKGQLVTSSVE